MTATDVTWHHGEVTRDAREALLGHRAACLWLTGLSGSGKSTLARRVERLLVERGVLAYVLDGDNLRHGLNADLGFSAAAREENVRRVGEVARLLVDAGVVVLAAFISPYRADRARVRALFEEGRFVEIHVATPLEECERRDPKGLYARARAGEITSFTGVSDPYEPPASPELVVDTTGAALDATAAEVVAWLARAALIPPA
ncbi:MAG: adenylyl-sulfate kinase [Sandaracinaceae bacterium]|nr:adenylyl-sulfate kinase [Sandaracinaceae bacterium]